MTRTYLLIAIMATALVVLLNHRAVEKTPVAVCAYTGTENGHTAIMPLLQTAVECSVKKTALYMPATFFLKVKIVVTPIMKELPFF